MIYLVGQSLHLTFCYSSKKNKLPPPENIWTRSILQSNIVKRVPYETLKFSFMVIFDRWISSSMKSEVYLSVFW